MSPKYELLNVGSLLISLSPIRNELSRCLRSFDGFHGRDAYLESQMRGDVGGGVGSGRDVIRRRTPALYDPWNDDIVSSRNDGQRSLKYIHTTNYPNKVDSCSSSFIT